MRIPDWVTDPRQSPEQRRKNLVFFHVRRACLQHNPACSLEQLSKACGFSAGALSASLSRRDGISRRMALAIEALVGRDIVTREQLAPDAFYVEGES
jgi:hypothetical protein